MRDAGDIIDGIEQAPPRADLFSNGRYRMDGRRRIFGNGRGGATVRGLSISSSDEDRNEERNERACISFRRGLHLDDCSVSRYSKGGDRRYFSWDLRWRARMASVARWPFTRAIMSDMLPVGQSFEESSREMEWILYDDD